MLSVAGCSQDNTPTAYGEVTETNFLQGCTGEGTGERGASGDYCRCAYQWFVDNVPVNAEAAKEQGLPEEPNFVQLNDELSKDPNALPAGIRDGLAEACGSGATGGTAPGTSAPGTSAPGTSAPGTSAPGTSAPQ